MPIVVIEDDMAECARFSECILRREDIKLAGMTSRSDEGLKLVKYKMPEGIILDLELHSGTGSGLQFLAELKNTKTAFKPLVVVITNNTSKVIYEHIRDLGVDYIFSKRQEGYSPDTVLGVMLDLRKHLHTKRRDDLPNDLQTLETPEELDLQIIKRIEIELDRIGINVKYNGRKYLEDAIFALITKKKGESDAVIYKVAKKHATAYHNVLRAIDSVIKHAWKTSDVESLQKHYTMRVDYNTGHPKPTEFIHYYANKIRNTM